MSIKSTIQNAFKYFNKRTSNEQGEYFANANPYQINEIPLSIEEMLSFSYITKSIQIIGNDIAKLNLIHRKKENGNWKEIDTILTYLLNKKPNTNMTAYEFKKTLIWNLFLYGKAPIYVSHYTNKNKEEKISELIPIYPNYMVKRINEDSGLIEYVLNFPSDPSGQEHAEEIINEKNIIWLEYEVIQNVSDVSFSSIFKSTLTKLKENENSIINSIRNDTGIAMFVNIPDVTDEESVNRVRNSINDMVREQKRTGSMAMVKDKRWLVEPNNNIIQSNIDYVTRTAIAREVAAIFGIPASKLGIEDNNKYNTMTERNRQYSDEALKPLLDKFATKFTEFFFPISLTDEITYKPIELLSMDPAALKDFGASAINNGFATPNEIRELIGWGYKEEGDVLMANAAIQPISLTIKKIEEEIELMKKPSNNKPF